jgi:hypothetical protein
MKQTTTTTMSIHYTKAVASFATKRLSRKKVAIAMKASITDRSVIHYLGGTSTQTPFENNFKKDTTFVRYERMKSLIPSGYKQVAFSKKGNAILPKNVDRGYFCNGDFFDCYFGVAEKLKAEQEHFWLDFCGMPKSELLESIYHMFIDKAPDNFKSLYLTFFLNPRNCKDVKESLFTNGEKTTEAKTQTLLNKFKAMIGDRDIDCEVFDSYMNGSSPMCVIKLERRNKETDMAKTASIENYVRLHSRGFSNKQIAVFWKAGIMQVAGYAACAKRKNLI